MIHSWMEGGIKGQGSGGETGHRSDLGGPVECLSGASGTHAEPISPPQYSLNRSNRPFLGQSSIVLLPGAITLKVSREDSQEGSALPSPSSPSRRGIPNAWGGRGEDLPLSPVGTHREESRSGSIRNTWHTSTHAAPFSCMPLVVALSPGHAPQEHQTKGDCPPFVKRVEAPVGRLPVPDQDSFPSPFLQPPALLQGAHLLSTLNPD